MKNTRTKLVAAMALALTLLIMPFDAAANSSVDHATNPMSPNTMVQDGFVGGWAYTVEGAPEGWEKGLLLIINQDGEYKAQVQTGGGTLMGENITIKKKTINFDVMVEGQKVAVSLTVNGSKISGTSNSSDGVFTINGVKSLSMK